MLKTKITAIQYYYFYSSNIVRAILYNKPTVVCRAGAFALCGGAEATYDKYHKHVMMIRYVMNGNTPVRGRDWPQT